jgi:hypothetical protein
VLSTDSKQRLGISRELNHPAFQAIRVEQVIITYFSSAENHNIED